MRFRYLASNRSYRMAAVKFARDTQQRGKGKFWRTVAYYRRYFRNM